MHRKRIVTLCLLLMGCGHCDDGPTALGPGAPGPVENLELLASDDGSAFVLRWEEPVFGSPIIEGYEIRFVRPGTPDIVLATDFTSTLYFPNTPDDIFLGSFAVEAYNNAGSSASKLASVNRFSKNGTVREINHAAGGQEGWELSSTARGPILMSLSEANRADIYITNLTAGVAIPPPYLFASPAIASSTPSDMPVIWPSAVLRNGMVEEIGTAPVDIIPFVASTNTSAEMIVGHYYAVWTQDNDYGMIYVEAVDANDRGRVNLTTWNTTVPGSRFIGLVTDPNPPLGVPAPVVFSDDFTVGDEWTTELRNVVNGADHSVSNPGVDGNPLGYRRMEHVLPATPMGGAATQLTVRHIYEGGTYDPCVDGAIDHINYFEDRRLFDPPSAIPGIPIGSAFLLEQNGLTFSTLVTDGGFNHDLSWETGQLLMITSESFPTQTKPDFSGSGTSCPMKFGFVRSNVINWPDPLVLAHGIDNWRVEIFRSGS